VTRESSEAIDLYARHMTNIHLARPAATQESASSALFLAAPASFYNTGHVLPIDGGWKCWLREGLLT
jgi:NAD(P)-dependent dehydrogenase (short-subunit alcohol dehydrogenase family)